ncbi:DegT/DnrJ/EryC1/StrS aminotransferase family protein [Flavobacteriaceae bacterium]|nr:DegT/DnrJ/EryC1/StrS aminotransferase family protein [Flavobacteriaceae bacterium]
MIPHNKPTIGDKELKATSDVLSSEWLSAGKQVKRFENEFCNYLELDNDSSVCVSSGSAAIFLILKILDFKNKNISIPSYTCVALKNAIELSNNKPVYLDTLRNSFNIDINAKTRKNSDFCIFPSMYGEILDETNLDLKNVAYDNCQSLGCKIHNKPIGSFSEISFYSFYSTKIITSGGQGGMIVSRNKSLIKEIKDFIYFDQKIDSKLRFNFQMSEIEASIGRVQLKRLQEFINKRQLVYNRYLKNGVRLKNFNTPTKTTNFFRAILEVDENEKILSYLNNNKINCINPLRKNELLDYSPKMKNSLRLTKKYISLPIFPDLPLKTVDFISEKIKEFLK